MSALCTLKCKYQLSELVKVDNYSDIIQSIAKFTITSLSVNIRGLEIINFFLSYFLYYIL